MRKATTTRALLLAGITLAIMTAQFAQAGEKIVFEKGSYTTYVKSVTTTVSDGGDDTTTYDTDKLFVGKRIYKDESGKLCRLVESQLKMEKFEANYDADENDTDAVADNDNDAEKAPDISIQAPIVTTTERAIPCPA